jgi:hypothetical protein
LLESHRGLDDEGIYTAMIIHLYANEGQLKDLE